MEGSGVRDIPDCRDGAPLCICILSEGDLEAVNALSACAI